MIVDMHCHLDLYPDPFKVANDCKAKGMYVLSVTTTPKAWRGTLRLTKGNKRIQTSLGLHPQLAHLRAKEIDLFKALLPEAKYVGEIGLDGSREYKAHRDVQLRVFRQILKSVHNSGGRIMTIHSRASASQVLDELVGIKGVPVLHWFTGTPSQLKRAIDMGCWFSVGPSMLSTKKGAELVSRMPKNRVLTETDGPFGQSDGKPLMPWDVEFCSKGLAKIWGGTLSEARHTVKENLKSLLVF